MTLPIQGHGEYTLLPCLYLNLCCNTPDIGDSHQSYAFDMQFCIEITAGDYSQVHHSQC